MKTLKYAASKITREFKNTDTFKRIEAKAEKNNMVAKEMGYDSAQHAFNKLGKAFLEIAHK